jgi:hypothetical protein
MAWHWIALCAAGGTPALFLLAGFGIAGDLEARYGAR